MTEPDTPDLPDEEPTPAWLHAALDAPGGRRRDHPGTPRRARRSPPSTTSTAAGRQCEAHAGWRSLPRCLVALGVGGVWLSSSDRGSSSSSDQIAGRSSSQDAATSERSPDAGADQSPTTLPPPASPDFSAEAGTRGPSSADDSAAQTAADSDLGTFATDAELRLAIRRRSPPTRRPAATLPPEAPVDVRCAVGTRLPRSARSSWDVGRRLHRDRRWCASSRCGCSVRETWPSTVVLDAATCTVRPG